MPVIFFHISVLNIHAVHYSGEKRLAQNPHCKSTRAGLKYCMAGLFFFLLLLKSKMQYELWWF